MDEHTRQRRRPGLHEELVPLSVAATLTYFHLAEVRSQLDQSEDLASAVAAVAAALAQVSALYRRGAQHAPMSARQVEELLLRPLRLRERPDLDGFLIRRGDLHGALRALREAHGPGFGKL